jgi:hypothetical protein
VTRRVWATLLAAGCTAAAPASAPVPTPVPGAPPAAAPVIPPPVATPPALVRLAPQQGRFLIAQRVDITTDYQGAPPQFLGFRTWFAVTVADSADALGRLPATFIIDSVVADSGVALPPTVNLYAARGMVVRGWVTPTGLFEDRVFSDSAAAQQLGRVLGFFARFFPHLNAAGVRPRDVWSDSLRIVEPGGVATLTRASFVESRAVGWETRDGLPALRLDVRETYQVTGAGDGGGQPVEVKGGGMRTGVDFLDAAGQYLGGVGRDSATYTITLPAQGLVIPQRQVATIAITVLPR